MQIFNLHTSWSRDSPDKGFKRFGVLWQLLFKGIFEREKINWRLWYFRYVLPTSLRWFYTYLHYWKVYRMVTNNRWCQGFRYWPQCYFPALKSISDQRTEMCSRRHGRGYFWRTSATEDMYIVLLAKRDLLTKDNQVAKQFLAVTGKHISQKTLARRLDQGGLFARWLVLCAHCRVFTIVPFCNVVTKNVYACVLMSE